MRAFYLAYEEVSEAPRQLEETLPIFNIPWWHNVILITQLKNNVQRLWYAQKTIDNGWLGHALETSIKSDLYSREGKLPNNFLDTLPEPQSIMAQ
jgi:hypothetical protein